MCHHCTDNLFGIHGKDLEILETELTQNEINFIEAAEDISELVSEGMTAGEISCELHLGTQNIKDIVVKCIVPAYRTLRRNTALPEEWGKDITVLSPYLDGIYNPDHPTKLCEDYICLLRRTALKYYRSSGYMPVLKSRKERGGMRYCPESLGPRLLTVQGLFILKSDPGLSERTLEELKKTEAPLLYGVYDGYRYLIKDHDAGEVAESFFLSGKGCGIGHLSVLLRDKSDRSLVSLITEYSSDKNIPFIAGAVLIHDLMEYEGGIFVYRPEPDRKNYIRYRWKPADIRAAPPVSYRRLSQSGYESYLGARDRYVLRTYNDSRSSTVLTAASLGISRQTAALWLKKNGERVESPCIPSEERGHEDAVLDLIIAAEYMRSRGDISAAAEKVSMPEEEYKRRAERIIKARNGSSDIAFIAAGIVCPGDVENAAKLLGMSPCWYVRRLVSLRKKLSGYSGLGEILPEYYGGKTYAFPDTLKSA